MKLCVYNAYLSVYFFKGSRFESQAGFAIEANRWSWNSVIKVIDPNISYFFCQVNRRRMPYPIVNPLGSIHYTSKISVPSLYWCWGYELPRISKSRRHLLYIPIKHSTGFFSSGAVTERYLWGVSFFTVCHPVCLSTCLIVHNLPPPRKNQ